MADANTIEIAVENGEMGPSTIPKPARSKRPRYTSLRQTNTKIYSVSFQENGFVWKETSPSAAKKFWTKQLFEENKINCKCISPNINIPRRYEEISDSDNEVFDSSDKTRIVSGRRTLSKSLDTRGASNYQSTSPSSTPIVFCIHGNKFGVARCCDDLVPGKAENDSQQNYGHEEVTIPDPDEHESSSQAHCHTERGTSGMDKKARNKLILASVLCLLFMVLEIIGGFLANSLAIATDAAHLLTDFASFMISLFSLWVASRPATRTMSFGWHRAEVIGATVSVLLIWVVTGILVYVAVERIINKSYEIDAFIMLITSGIGVLVNIIMGCTLHQHGHGHAHGGGSSGGHGHAHGENINVRAAFIHVLGDFLQSVGVFIAALIIYFVPNVEIIDPICTFVFSVLVLLTTVRILRDTMNVLMEGIPRDVSFNVVQETFLSVEGIVAVHNLRIWGLTTDKTALAAHLAVAPGSNAQTILREASTRIRAQYNFYEMTLQVEEFEDNMDDCTQCKPPVS